MKVVIFTHNADIDGMGCAILAKLNYGEENCDIVYTTPHSVNEDFVNFFGITKTYDDDEEKETYNIYDSDKIREYDRIFITDLSISGELLQRVAKNNISGNKVRIFDHHEFNVKKGINNYLIADVRVSDYNGLCSGTSLFYEYLSKKCGLQNSNILKSFVEKVRRQDTWEWKTKYQDDMADDLAQLFNAVGKEMFNDLMIQKIKDYPEAEFFFTDEEEKIIEMYKQKIQTACRECYESMNFVGKGNLIFGVGNIPYKFRNEMAEYIRDNNIEIDVLALPNYENKSCSFRSINENVDVNEIAMIYGGGGHKGASSAPISKDLCEYLKIEEPKEVENYYCERCNDNNEPGC